MIVFRGCGRHQLVGVWLLPVATCYQPQLIDMLERKFEEAQSDRQKAEDTGGHLLPAIALG